MAAIGGTYGWEYTNSSGFCGTACHTMPPQNVTYLNSPHANVYCTECHIGRAFVGTQLSRKIEDVREIYAMTFKTYEFPIVATRLQPSRNTCEKCHFPESFSGDSLRVIPDYADDEENTPTNIYLIMKTGGGSKQAGLGRGIHWHIVKKVEYYSLDARNQEIPYVRVYNDDGTVTEYVDIESGFDSTTLDESQLKVMDCDTCHNRVTHDFKPPEVSVNEAMSRGLISPEIPGIHQRAVEVLSTPYEIESNAMVAIENIGLYYQNSAYYAGHEEQIQQAVETIKKIYKDTVFLGQKVDWTTHPNNIGHIYSPGCFRCHDGKHLDTEKQAIRLECNICHSIPIVSGSQDFVTRIEISHGPEPETHLNPNWITMHNQAFDSSCSSCHTTEDPGGTSNTSFCSNSACHGNVFTYAGFDAPALREIIKDQLPPPAEPVATPPPPAENEPPTYDSYVGPLFVNKCGMCHSAAAHQKGLDLSTYAAAILGGEDGPVILPGDSANSLLVQIQSKQHFANFSTEELDIIKNWIDAGAPEN